MSEWIDIKEKKPKAWEWCAVAAMDADHRRVTVAQWRYGHFSLTGRRACWRVTHWMPLPTAPEEKK